MSIFGMPLTGNGDQPEGTPEKVKRFSLYELRTTVIFQASTPFVKDSDFSFVNSQLDAERKARQAAEEKRDELKKQRDAWRKNISLTNKTIADLEKQLAEYKQREFTPEQLDSLLARWDQTEPELQREIVVAFAVKCGQLEKQLAEERKISHERLGEKIRLSSELRQLTAEQDGYTKAERRSGLIAKLEKQLALERKIHIETKERLEEARDNQAVEDLTNKTITNLDNQVHELTEERDELRDEQKDIARILECPDCEDIKTPSNIPNVVRDVKAENKRLRDEVEGLKQTNALLDKGIREEDLDLIDELEEQRAKDVREYGEETI